MKLPLPAIIALSASLTWSAGNVFVPKAPETPKRFCTEYDNWLRKVKSDDQWTEISTIPGIVVKMPYATFQNISGHDLYCGSKKAWLNVDAARKLTAAAQALQAMFPGYKLQVFDAGRPRYAQEQLHEQVKGTRWRNFVASPAEGSLHSFGMAVDLTILDASGNPLDMGTGFDVFEERSGYQGESAALANGTLTRKQVDNRTLLRKIMKAGGFLRIDGEWWHFNAEKSKVVMKWYETPD